MKAKLKGLYDRFDLWYWTSGAEEIVSLGSKALTFLICFMATGVLTLSGMIELQKIWGSNHPFILVLFALATYVTVIGAGTIAKS